MKIHLSLFAFLFLLTLSVSAQESEVVSLNRSEIEAVFIEQNLELIAERMNVPMADAVIVQAKLWDNPTLSVGNVNIWKSGQEKEFSVELSQLIQTAHKRGKLVSREKTAKEISISQFEDVLRGLKAELRKAVNEIVYLKSYREILFLQSQSLQQLIESYEKQVVRGNIAKTELLRLQSALFEVESERNEVQTEWNSQQKALKILLNFEPFVTIHIINESEKPYQADLLSLSELINSASNVRPDLKMSQLQTRYFEKSLVYEKSLRMPDITLSAAYDRYGGVWKNFVGVGISVDLPFLNRNQGNIKIAQISRDQSRQRASQQQNIAKNEIAEALSNYTSVYGMYQKMVSNPLLKELDAMLDVYTKNLLNRNTSMLEYLDFLDAYKSNKQTFLSMRRNVSIQFEELQYAIGSDIK